MKAILAMLVAGAGSIITVLGNGELSDVSGRNWLIAALAVLGSGGAVWLVENGPAAPVIKAVFAALTAGIGSLVLSLEDSVLSQGEWISAFVVAVVATGLVYQVPNDDTPPSA